MREILRRNRDEMQDRRRARGEADPLGTRTYTLAVRDEEENSDDEEAGIQRGGIEDSNDEEAGIQRGGIEESSDEEEGIQRGEIEEEVDHDDYLQESASETDNDAVSKIAPKKTGEGEEEASVSVKNTVAIEPSTTAEKRDAEEIEINILKTLHVSSASDDVGKITVKVDVHAARADGVYQEDEAAPAPVKRMKIRRKTRKNSKTVSGSDNKAAVDIPGLKPSDQARNTGRSQKMKTYRGDEKKAAIGIPGVKPSDQASNAGRSQKTRKYRRDKKKAAIDIPGVKPSDQASNTGRSQKMRADGGDEKKAVVDIPGVKPSDEAGGL